MAEASGTLSSVLGWVSIACWIVVFAPQIVENFRLKSGEGLSVVFVLIWLIGDLCNLSGALIAGLLPTVIILAVYYTLCDSILLFQIYYYRWTNKRKASSTDSDSDSATVGEETPLLSDTTQGPKDRVSISREFIKYAGAILFVFVTGVAGWWISGYFDKGEGSGEGTPERPDDTLEWRSQIMGWTSAALYIGARIPQIFKNFETRCEGLSPFLFLFSITGNTTYALSICAASMDPKYLLKNASWLAGSSLTVFLDVFVLCQFIYYRSVERGNTQPVS